MCTTGVQFFLGVRLYEENALYSGFSFQRFSLTFHNLLLSLFKSNTDVTCPQDTTDSIKKLIRHCNVSVFNKSTITMKITVLLCI